MASSRVTAMTVTGDDLEAARTDRIHAERRGGEARIGQVHAERRGGEEKKHAPVTSTATTSPVTGRSTGAGAEEGRRSGSSGGEEGTTSTGGGDDPEKLTAPFDFPRRLTVVPGPCATS
jgi:hypothetical protein